MTVPAAPHHVLLIDPERYVWEVVRHGLGSGYRISAVASRSAAIRILNEDVPRVIIVEWILPKALGLPLALLGLRRQIPVVMTTGNHDLARRLARLGAVILRKPHSLSELRECVRDAVINPDSNFQRNRAALQRLRSDHREREAVLRLLGDMRDQAIQALASVQE
jgi:DNA-binding response OmpR family regulator